MKIAGIENEKQTNTNTNRLQNVDSSDCVGFLDEHSESEYVGAADEGDGGGESEASIAGAELCVEPGRWTGVCDEAKTRDAAEDDEL